MNSQKRGIYLHIPFCASKCGYCGFYSRCAGEDLKRAYVSALCREIEAGETGEKVSTVYVGGGTPSVLPAGSFETIWDSLSSSFDLSSVEEMTVECNPDSVSPSFFRELKRVGVNRISMGCQSFVWEELVLLGRRHTPERAQTAFFEAREAGFENISLDLMLAIPLQTPKSLEVSLKKTAELSPEHISAYLLKVEPGTPFFDRGVSSEDDVSADLYLLVSSFLAGEGYEHYEVSNFARNRFRAVHNSSYWQGREYYAFGPGAYGYLNGERFFIEPDIEKFIAKSARKTVEERLSEEEKQREKRILALRTSDGIEKSALTSSQTAFLSSLCQQGLAVESEGRFALTPSGFLVSNAILAELF